MKRTGISRQTRVRAELTEARHAKRIKFRDLASLTRLIELRLVSHSGAASLLSVHKVSP
jgi:hypothetical protein